MAWSRSGALCAPRRPAPTHRTVAVQSLRMSAVALIMAGPVAAGSFVYALTTRQTALEPRRRQHHPHLAARDLTLVDTTENHDAKSHRPPASFTPHPFEYDEELELRVESLSNLGEGVARVPLDTSPRGWVVFVPFVLPGELVKARVKRNLAGHSRAEVVEVIAPSPQRVAPICPLHGVCGGCQYQHMAYESQLEWKQRQVATLLERIGRVDPESARRLVRPTMGSPRQLHYRSKLTPHWATVSQPHARGGGGGRDCGAEVVLGFRATTAPTGPRAQLIDVAHCPIATEEINEALPAARRDLVNKRTEVAPSPAQPRGEEQELGQRPAAASGTMLLRHVREGVVTDATRLVSQEVGGIVFRFLAGDFFQCAAHVIPRRWMPARCCCRCCRATAASATFAAAARMSVMLRTACFRITLCQKQPVRLA